MSERNAEPETTSEERKRGCLPLLLKSAAVVVLALIGLWTFGAVVYDGPWSRNWNLILAVVWAVVFVWLWVRPPECCLPQARAGVFGSAARRLPAIAMILLVVIPWSMIQPSNERDWQPEFRQTGRAEVAPDGMVTLHEVRDFSWREDGSFDERWESRSYRLDRLQAVDLYFDAFMGDILAHPMLCFDFGEDGRVVLSVETRRELGESFSALGGLYKMFELQYIFGDERDFINVRTVVRRQPVYRYPLRGDLDRWRAFFLISIERMNGLYEQPEFYNVITQNCTTSLFALIPAEKRHRWDLRILLNGRLDELLWERGVLDVEAEDLADLRAQSLVKNRPGIKKTQMPGRGRLYNQGLINFRPHASKSVVLRVARLAPYCLAMAAMRRSSSPAPKPAWTRAR